MTTTRELCEVLAAALGLEPELVKGHAHALREAGPFATDEADTDDVQAEPEHAAVLLISLMSGVPPDKAPDAVRLFGGLPLDSVTRCELMLDGQFEAFRMSDVDPFMNDLAVLGETFGAFLAGLVRAFNETPEVNIEPGEIILGGGLGTASASVHILVLADGVDVGGTVQFTLAPMGGLCRPPDDAPPARLDRYASVPGVIFSIFRKFFTGDRDGPRKVPFSCAELTALTK